MTTANALKRFCHGPQNDNARWLASEIPDRRDHIGFELRFLLENQGLLVTHHSPNEPYIEWAPANILRGFILWL